MTIEINEMIIQARTAGMPEDASPQGEHGTDRHFEPEHLKEDILAQCRNMIQDVVRDLLRERMER